MNASEGLMPAEMNPPDPHDQFKLVPFSKALKVAEEAVGTPLGEFINKRLRPPDLSRPFDLPSLPDDHRVLEDVSKIPGLGEYFPFVKKGVRYALIQAKEKANSSDAATDTVIRSISTGSGYRVEIFDWWKEPRFIDVRQNIHGKPQPVRTNFLEFKGLYDLYNDYNPADPKYDLALDMLSPITEGTRVKAVGILPKEAEFDGVIQPNAMLFKEQQQEGPGKVMVNGKLEELQSADMNGLLAIAKTLSVNGLATPVAETVRNKNVLLSFLSTAANFFPNLCRKISLRMDKRAKKMKRRQIYSGPVMLPSAGAA